MRRVILCAYFIFSFITIYADEINEPIGEKDGIKLYANFKEPYEKDDPRLICALENTTDTPVVFQFRGSSEAPAFEIHLYDSRGLEIEKNAVWRLKYETGDSMHVRYGSIPNGQKLTFLEINLLDAYGDKWSAGVRLEILWNVGDHRTGQGPMGGVFGIGSGVRGVINIPPPGGDSNAEIKSVDNKNEGEHKISENPDKLKSLQRKEIKKTIGIPFVTAALVIAILLILLIWHHAGKRLG